MVNCPNCKNEVAEGSQLCIHCGAKFDEPGNAIIDNPDVNGKSNPGNGNPGNSNNNDTVDEQYKNNHGNNNNDNTDITKSMKNNNDEMPYSSPVTSSDENPDIDPVTGGRYSTSGQDSATRNKWLKEQEKIKMELEALKGKVSTKFKMDSPFGDDQEDEIFKLDEDNFQDLKDASLGLNSLGRPLTPEEEQKKDELLLEINDLKNEGYDVSRLERIVGVDPTGAWKEFVKFMDDIETLQKLRERYSELDTTGFEAESQSIRNKLDNPDLIHQIERELNQIEEKISLGVADGDEGGLRELIDAGKEAFKQNEYQKALNFYKSALKIDPNNREVEFYRRKTEAKLQALSGMTKKDSATESATLSSPVAPANIPDKTAVRSNVSAIKTPGVAPRLSKRPGAPKLKVKSIASPPKTPIPTGGNVEVKQPLSVSMTPKLPPRPATAQPSAPSPPTGPAPAPKIKPKRIQIKKPGTGVAPKTVQPVASVPVPAKKTENPAEIEALGFNAFINKEYEKALEYYEQVLALDPNFPGAATQRDKCMEALGRS